MKSYTKASTLFVLSSKAEELGKEIQQQAINELLTIKKLKSRVNVFFDNMETGAPVSLARLSLALIGKDIGSIPPQIFNLAQERVNLFIKGLVFQKYLSATFKGPGNMYMYLVRIAK